MSRDYSQRLVRLFAVAEAANDWSGLIAPSRTRLSRSALLKECGFPRSTLYGNRSVVELLENTERRLAQRGILQVEPGATSRLDESEAYRNVSERLDSLLERHSIAEKRVEELLAKLAGFE